MVCARSPSISLSPSLSPPIPLESSTAWVPLILSNRLSFTRTPPSQLEKLRNIIPFEQMTIEDLNEAFPETKLDKKKYPYWPHKPIENM